MKTYRILAGSFNVGPGPALVAGDTIDLEDDVASRWTHLLQPVEPANATPPADQPDHPAQE